MKHSISKLPKNLEDPRLRLWKIKHLEALKMLKGKQAQVERPIDEALMARIKGAIFKRLIYMHLKARQLYRLKKTKKIPIQI